MFLSYLESTRSGVEEYEGMEVDESESGPGPQRCKYLTLTLVANYWLLSNY